MSGCERVLSTATYLGLPLRVSQVCTTVCARRQRAEVPRGRTKISTPNALLSELMRIKGVFPLAQLSSRTLLCTQPTNKPNNPIDNLFATDLNRPRRDVRDTPLLPPTLPDEGQRSRGERKGHAEE